MIVLVFSQSIVAITFFYTMNKAYFVMAIVILCASVASAGFVFPLLGFHIVFLSKNMTTNEYIKDNWEGLSGNPY